jgi:hypothetical protein
VIDVLAGLKADVEALVGELPSRTERQKLDAAVGALTSFQDYASGLIQQNRELVEELRAVVERLARRLEYAIAGLPIQRFQLPDPPQQELELLQAKHRAVPLLGRDADLGALWHWLLGPEPISARLIVGGAGTGKTRLAFELLLRVYDRLPHWQAGLLTGRVLRRFDASKQPLDWTWQAPTLVVVD